MKAEVILSTGELKAVHKMFKLQWQDILSCKGNLAAAHFTQSAHFRQNALETSPWMKDRKFLSELLDGNPAKACAILDDLLTNPPLNVRITNFLQDLVSGSKDKLNRSLRWLVYTGTRARHSGLHIAASKNYCDVLERLHNVKVDLNIPDILDHSALCLAAEHGQLQAAQTLIACGADVNRAGLAGWSPLIIAARLGRTEIVKALTACEQLDINHTDICGRSAAAHAILGGHHDIFQHLLEKGVDITSTDVKGRNLSDLIESSPGSHRGDMMYLLCKAKLRRAALLEAGEDPIGKNLLEGQVDTATLNHMASASSSSPAMIRAASIMKLVNDGHIPPSSDTAEGRMLIAMERKDHYNVRAIIGNEVIDNPSFNIDARNDEGLSVLFMAAQRRANAVVLYCLNRKADPNVPNAMGVTPLMHVIDEQNDDLTEIFLACDRTDPTARDIHGRSARDRAVLQGRRALYYRLDDAEKKWNAKHKAPAFQHGES